MGLLKKNQSERLNSNKQDKEAQRGAMQEMGRKKFLAKGVIACKKSWRN